MQYMEARAPLATVEKDLGCICVRWVTSDEMDYSDCGKELNIRGVNVGKWYGPED